MNLKRLLVALVVALIAAGASADPATLRLLDEAWPNRNGGRLSEIGRGVGVVFSPDLSVPGNCRFYSTLGFGCFQEPSWSRVLDDIRNHNISHPENRLRTLILETHGTNGNGLKLQESAEPNADRSYISIGALQERLEPDGIRTIILSACNSGRLLRPAIYRTLDANPGDKLFLPATCGIVNASGDYNPRRSRVVIAIPASSHIETTLTARLGELAPATRRVLEYAAKKSDLKLPRQFAVSDMMMQMLLMDPRLMLSTTGVHVEELSGTVQPESASEALFASFLNRLNSLAADEVRSLPPPVRDAKKKPAAAPVAGSSR